LAVLTLIIVGYFFLTPRPVDEEILIKFSSEEDFKAYLTEVSEFVPLFAGIAGAPATMAAAAMEERAAEMVKLPERISPTTVQVRGIDEPDVVKTDGVRIYFSPRTAIYFPLVVKETMRKTTKVIMAYPPEKLSLLSEINETGDLFLTPTTLLILADQIHGYDVTDPTLPTKKFTIELNGSVVGARLYEGRVYIVVKDRIDYHKPCPIWPLTIRGRPFIIPCQEIYHPTQIVPVDVTYTALILNPETET
jgi:uncharacterized secreted protein with C-terminal beta-propeller domain